MSRRKKIILIIIIVILGILLLYFFVGGRRTAQRGTTDGGKSRGGAQIPEAPLVTNKKSFSPEELAERTTENQILAIARTFAERYGSFSNQGGFTNLLDLEPIVTRALYENLVQFHEASKKDSAKEYYGVITRALGVTPKAIDDASATVDVQTQREEAKISPTNTRVYYQALKLQMVRVGETWLVSGAQWQ